MSIFGQISDTWQAIVHLIIRPPRHEYSVNRDLGPKCCIIGGKLVIREDLELMNPRGLVLKCSHFQPAEPEDSGAGMEGEDGVPKLRPRKQAFPCVIYCHGNAGSRVDATSLLPLLLPEEVSVFCFDFAGAGQSEGKFLSLGHFEKDDLATVADYLTGNTRVSRIGLWGHSMGACTCLLYAANGGDQVASAMVLDSSFVSLDVVIAETAASAKQKLGESVAPAITLMPDMFIPMAVAAIRRSIQNQAEYDIRDVNPLGRCGELLVPALFGHADADEMIAPNHSLRLHEAYGGNSTMIKFEGRHNSPRSDFFLGSAVHFLKCILRPSGEAHPAEALVYHNASHVRGLMAGSARSSHRRTSGKGFRSHSMSHEGDQCFHIGRTAGNLALLANMCLECNPELRKQRATVRPEVEVEELRGGGGRAARRRAPVQEGEGEGDGGRRDRGRSVWSAGGEDGDGESAPAKRRGGGDGGQDRLQREHNGGARSDRDLNGAAGGSRHSGAGQGQGNEEHAQRATSGVRAGPLKGELGGAGKERRFDWEEENDDGGVAWGQPEADIPLLPSFHLCNIDGSRRATG